MRQFAHRPVRVRASLAGAACLAVGLSIGFAGVGSLEASAAGLSAAGLNAAGMRVAGMGASGAGVVQAVGAPTACPAAPQQLTNPGFEQPVVKGNFVITKNVPGWKTTASDGEIEIWKNGNGNVPAPEGNQFAELNANEPSTLYQDVATVPGTTIVWSLLHRGRSGVDVMSVSAGPSQDSSQLRELAQFGDGQEWGAHAGAYTVPAGQTMTRFAFVSVSTSSGRPTYGNLLDKISFGDPPCLTATKSASVVSGAGAGGAAQVGSVLDYVVSVANEGGATANSVAVTDLIPAGMTYVPGSMRQVDGAAAGPFTDASDGDGGTYNASSGTVTLRPGRTGTGSWGSLLPDEHVRVAFSAQVTDPARTSVANTAQVAYADGLGGTPTFPTNTVTTPILAPVDLSSVGPGVQVVEPGDDVPVAFTLTNAGPGDEPDAVLLARLPAGFTLEGSSVTCTQDADIVRCPVGALARLGSTAVTLTIGVDGAFSGAVVMPAGVTGQNFDVDLENNRSPVPFVVQGAPTPNVAAAAGPDASVVAGASGTLTGAVSNVGADPVSGVTISGVVSPNFRIASATATGQVPCVVDQGANSYTCDVGALAEGASASVTLAGSALPSAAGETVTHTVTVGAVGDAFVGDDEAVSLTPIVGVADVEVTKALSGHEPISNTATYSITVVNHGPSDARDVVVDDTDGLDADLGTLAPGQVVNYQDVVTLVDYSEHTDTAAVSSSTDDPALANNSATVTFTPTEPVDVAITVDPARLVVTVGEYVRFTLRVTNVGSTTATGVVVTWTDPVEQMPVGLAAAGRSAVGAQLATWEVGTLAAGESASLVLEGTAQRVRDVRRGALVGVNEVDAIPANNAAFARLIVTDELAASGADPAAAVWAAMLAIALGLGALAGVRCWRA